MSVMGECQHNGCSIFHIMEVHLQSTSVLILEIRSGKQTEWRPLNEICGLSIGIMEFDQNVLICLMIQNSIILTIYMHLVLWVNTLLKKMT